MTISIEAVVARYMQLREQKEALDRQYKEDKAKLEDGMDKLETYILARMTEDGVDSYKTGYGTAYRGTVDWASVANWDEVLDYVKQNEAYHLLERRVNKIAVRNYLDEGTQVPGVDYGQKVKVSIRRPTA